MLKLAPLEANKFYNFKCGEIFCLTATVYNVTCCLCGQKVHLAQFMEHFQLQHLPKDDCESTEDVPRPIKEEEDDPIKTEIDGLQSDENVQEIDEENDERTDAQRDDEMEDEKEIDLTQLEIKLAISDEENLESDVPENDDKEWQINDYSDESGEEDDKSNREFLPYPCTKCTRTYKSKRSLQNHLRMNHDPTRKRKAPKLQHKCDECGEVFRSERNLRGHKWKHTGIFCDICGKPFTQAGNMMRHKIRHTGIKAHKCKECDNSFYTNKELRAHMMRHTQILPIICEICGRRCRDRGVLTAHMRRHTGERPAKCPVCGKCFFSFHDLNVHSVTHSTERPFQCDICSATFQRKKSLRVHKKLHSKDGKKHECKVCGRTFAQSGGLNSHMRTHDAALCTSSINNGSVPTVALLDTSGLVGTQGEF